MVRLLSPVKVLIGLRMVVMVVTRMVKMVKMRTLSMSMVIRWREATQSLKKSSKVWVSLANINSRLSCGKPDKTPIMEKVLAISPQLYQGNY